MRVPTKGRLLFLLNSRLAVLSRLVKYLRYIRYKVKLPVQVKQMRNLTRETPLYLSIETTSICNASCIFCTYPTSKRKKGVMSLPLFEKIIEDYARMGGGPVNLTPLEGEVLLDPFLEKRLEILRKYAEIRQVIVTTNGIALERYSDQQIRRFLEDFSIIILSIGGLDEATYKTMYNVDRFPQVKKGMERLLKLQKEVSDPAHLSFAFRTNDCDFETRFKLQLDNYRNQGVKVSHMNVYGNICGIIPDNEEKGLVFLPNNKKKYLPCVYPSLTMNIAWDGAVSACCCGFLGEGIWIGHAEKESLAEIWSGEKRLELIDSFAKKELLPVCRDCSIYLSDAVFERPCFKDYRPHQSLPLDFFQF